MIEGLGLERVSGGGSGDISCPFIICYERIVA